MRIRPAPLRASTSLAVLLFDWIVLALNLGTRVHDFASSSIFGFCGVALTVAMIEQKKEASFAQTVVRSLFAGAVVAVPTPILGTAVAAVCLLWSALARGQSQPSH